MEKEKYIMIYQSKKNNNMIILGKEFVLNNQNKGKLIYKNKKYPLQHSFQLNYIMIDNLKIKMILNKSCYNKSFMFKDCSSLILIKFDNNINNKENTIFNNKKSLNNILYENEENFFNDKNKKDSFSSNNKEYNNIKIEKIKNFNNNNKQLDLKWDTNISAINEIFANCSSLISLPDISKWDTSKVIDMNKIFYNCRNLSSLSDISEWDTNNATNMDGMFFNCSSLISLPDISKWNTQNVTSMNKMFYFCSSISSLPDISKWNNIINLNYLIKGCFSLKSLPNISERKTRAINMNSMIEKSSAIINLIYEIKEERIIQIFSGFFVNKNQIKSKMIINNKLFPLTEKYHIKDDYMKYLKIKLVILNNKRVNMKGTYYDCKFLKQFYNVSQEETKLKEVCKK